MPRDAASEAWTARMISPACDAGAEGPAMSVFREFNVEGDVADAHLSITALGLYRAFLNGRPVTDALLTPGWSCYDSHLYYQSHDVSDLVRPGKNLIEVWLGDGWWRSQMMWKQAPSPAILNCWGDRVGAMAELRAEGRLLLATDDAWSSRETPVRRSGIYFGEVQDASAAAPEEAGVEALPFDTALLRRQDYPLVLRLVSLPPGAIHKDAQGREVFDFGQNIAGFVRLTASGPAGARVLVEHAEVLDAGKVFDTRNLRSAEARTEYVLTGAEKPETFEPVFTFQGFRYARITCEGGATLEQVSAVPISSVPDRAGHVETGEAAVNRLVENTVWSQRANFIEVPTDCPQRDERLGWTGDAQVFAGAACYLADCESFLRKYLRDVVADQRPDGAIPHFSPDPTRLHPEKLPNSAGSAGWGDAITVIPWTLYQHYGSADILQEFFEPAKRWVDFLWSVSDGPIVQPSPRRGGRGFTFGDWLQPFDDARKPGPAAGDEFVATVYHYRSTRLVERFAQVLGRPEEAATYGARADAIRAAFQAEFVTETGRIGASCQTSYALAFRNGLVPADRVDGARAHFAEAVRRRGYRLGTGFLGTPELLPALADLGMWDIAARVLLQREVPGWLYQVEMGATTIWERWDGIRPDGSLNDPFMNSYNHYAYGAVCQWFFEGLAGFRPDPEAPGFRRVLLDPVVLPQLGHVRASHDSRAGRIEAGWSLAGRQVRYTVTLPEGAEGVLLPSPRRLSLVIDGRSADAAVTHSVPSGTTEISFALEEGDGDEEKAHGLRATEEEST